jgi:predicted TIM-barrel fold metal-dependent hydrolase
VRIIDIHAHVFPDELAAKAVKALAEAADDHPVFYDGTVSGLIAEMDRAGIDAAVTQPVATKPTQVRAINDWAATTASKRITPFGAMHPDFEDPAKEIARMALLGLRGFKMHPEYQVFAPDEDRMLPILEAAAEHGLIAFFHAGIDIEIPTLHGTPDAFARMMDAMPDVTVVLAHMGGFRQWREVEEHICGRDVWIDTSYTLGHLPDDEFVDLIHTHGVGRVLFGTDGPWTDPVEELLWLRRLGLAEDELDAVLGGNAERLLV